MSEILIKTNIILFLVIVFGCQGSVQSATISLNEEIHNIPAKISHIETCGSWEYNGQAGFYRVIYVEWYAGCSLLYIQWMLDYHIMGWDTNVLHTLSIEEFNANDHIELTFDTPECQECDDGIQLNIVADSGHDSSTHAIEITVFQPFGKYRFIERLEKEENKQTSP